jgi:transcriptional regulator with XRE-family HTH domain
MTSIINVALGSRVRAWRRSRGLSMVELGALVGVSYQQVQKYESGRSEMTAAKVWDIAQAVGASVTDLYAAVPIGTGLALHDQRVAGVDGVARREVHNLVMEYSKLPPVVRAKFGQLASSLSAK